MIDLSRSADGCLRYRLNGERQLTPSSRNNPRTRLKPCHVLTIRCPARGTDEHCFVRRAPT